MSRWDRTGPASAHAARSSGGDGGRLVGGFADRHRVIVPDLSGSESAVDDGGPLTVELLAEQAAAVIENARGGPVDVAGFSLGSAVAAASSAGR
ncbi:alpha/beta fold hydrolase [Streptosporangium roseum]|uniref:alpha/beta fold hydrolase n=1 Tax=Streptosporangium roseum TaxID=2001 RepID=UPI00331D9145